MPDNVCPNCGKKHRWYELKKIDPITKEQLCRKCNTPFRSKNEKHEAPQKMLKKVIDASSTRELDMTKLVNDVLVSFNQIRESRKVITYPSIPVLYFGDYNQYQKSYPKIITVGLNPSHNEFPTDSRFTRFNEAEKLDVSNTLSENEVTTYLNSLNNYFNNNPYNWFDSYDQILNGLNTSYYMNSAGNNALHTDLCSPFSTNLTWRMLRDSTQYTLSREGRKFWHRLVEILEPDMILCSVARKHLERILFKKSGWRVFTSITKKKDGSPRSKPYDVEVSESRIGNKKMYLVFGQAAQQPFGSLSTKIKLQLGEELNRLFN
jgi:hypothetical protein